MRLNRLTLTNWRSFKGTNTIEFTKDKQKNVTVIVGQNGTGKTALLNALTWVLYGDTTAGFRRPNDLFNHAALKEIPKGKYEHMKIILELEHEGGDYELIRKQEAILSNEGNIILSSPTFNATLTRNGLTKHIEQDDINGLLPPGLHPFFFFPAENIGKDIDQNDAAAIRASMSRAIDVLLGIERYSNSLKIISVALSDYLRLPSNTPRDSSLDDAENDLNIKRQKWEQAIELKTKLPKEIKKLEALIEDLNGEIERAAQYQEALNSLNNIKSDIKETEISTSNARERQIELINANCALLFGRELFSKASKILDKAHRDNLIPPRVSTGLLEDIIENNKCICGRELGHNELLQIEAVRSKTVEDQIAESANSLRGRLPRLVDGELDKICAQEILKYSIKICENGRKLAKLRASQRELLNEQPEISYNDPNKTLEAWKEQNRRLQKYETDLSEIDGKIDKFENDKKASERKYQQILSKYSSAKLVSRARNILSEVEDALTKIQNAIRSSARQDVERAMNEFYGPLLLKDYYINLTEEFRHEIVDKQTNSVVGVSSSEIALATFAFVGSLAGLMPVYSNLERLIPTGEKGSVGELHADRYNAYPVVLDAPHSPFGPKYALEFSKALPDLLPQSIVIVREDQLKYLDILIERNRIGSAYLLQLNTSQTNTSTINWMGKQYALVVKQDSEGPSFTNISQLPIG
ncbi:MAG: hypothetical protein C4555_07950 [Dehalococcoidia bacterium]|jgi:DNA sulfur modification protein DndD|nr:MAG: hypothetical protein C4555_07950 [Dehalococcoidia bacterium]